MHVMICTLTGRWRGREAGARADAQAGAQAGGEGRGGGGEHQRTVSARRPSASLSRCVSLHDRYGTCERFFSHSAITVCAHSTRETCERENVHKAALTLCVCVCATPSRNAPARGNRATC